MVKRSVFVLAVLAIVTGLAGAEQLTTVAVIDVNKVYTTFYRDSQPVRELERLKQRYQEEIDEQMAQLEDLREQRVQARNNNDQERAEELSDQIYQKQQFIEDLTERRQRQLEQRRNQLISNDFLQRMQNAIQYVAENEGYSVVLSTELDSLQWWSPTVDITESVLQRLRQTAGS